MPLKGTFTPPGDKSISHRLGLLALVAGGRARVENFSPCADCASTLGAASVLGVLVERRGGDVILRGAESKLAESALVDCGNSGTTMRLLMGVLAGIKGDYTLDGDHSLRRRPMERVAKPLRQMGASVECTDGRPPVRVQGGPLQGIQFPLPVASAQLKSAVLLAGIQAQGETMVGEPVKSRDHSERLLAQYGADIAQVAGGWRVRRSRLTLPESVRVPGDASGAAFFLCAAAIIPGSEVTAEGVLLNPTRLGFVEVLRRMGARVEVSEQGQAPEPWGRIRVAHGPDLQACQVEAQEIPLLVDEVPILALVATQARGTTVFRSVEELRIKETDRVAAIISQLGLMGASMDVDGQDLLVKGVTPLQASDDLDSLGDHRMAMSLRLGLCLSGGQGRIADEGCAAVSYPGFHDDLQRLWR